MKSNRILLVSILLLIFAIGAVSAADENITATTDEVLSSEPAEELEVTQPGTFGELTNLVKNTSSGKTLELEKDYVNSKSSTEVTLSKAITIDGQGHTIDANGKSNIFHVTNNKVVLKNINFINSFTKNYSAVYGTCTIINCTFTDCTSQKDGGAIYNGTVYNSTFTNCKAYRYEDENQLMNSDWHVCKGGAIYNGDAYNCCFINCNAVFAYHDGFEPDCHGMGGAIYHGNAYNCSFMKCTSVGGGAIIGDAYNSHFEECSAFGIWSAGCGGAIQGDAHNCSFVNCRSEYGGSIYGGNAYGCSFVGSSVIDGAGGSSGGAINLGDAYNCYFENCSAYEGAAISYGTAYNCYLIECSCNNKNGAIIKKGNAEDSTFIKCTVKNNGAIVDGDYDNCIFVPSITLSCSNLTVNYGEGGILPVGTLEGVNGITVDVKVYKGGKLINSFSTTTGTNLLIDAAPGNYIIALGCKYADPLNLSLTVNKGSPKMVLANNYAKSGETANVKISMSKHANGFVKITINGKTYRVQINSGVASVDVPNLVDGAYPVSVTYAGNVYHIAETMNDVFHVGEKFTQGIELIVKNIKVGETERLTANLAKDTTGFVRFIIGEDTYKVKIEKGVAYVDLDNLKARNYGVTLKYAGNYKYNAESVSKTFTVSKSSPSIKVTTKDIKVGETETIKVNIANDAPGNVHITVNGDLYKAKITNGLATLNLTDLKVGTYDVSVKYAGNYKYNSQTVTKTFVASKSSPGLDIRANNIDMGVKDIIATLAKDATGNVIITADGKTYNVEINNGTATLRLSGLAIGTYTVKVKYAGDDKYDAQTKSRTVTVKKIATTLALSAKTVSGKTTVTANVNAPGSLKMTYKGTTYIATIANGKASFTIDNPITESDTVTVEYDENDRYEAAILSRQIPTMTVSAKAENGKTTITASINNDYVGYNYNLAITYEGTTYTKEIKNGKAQVTIDGIAHGSHSVKVVSGYISARTYGYMGRTLIETITI